MNSHLPAHISLLLLAASPALHGAVNDAAVYPVTTVSQTFTVDIDPRVTLSTVDKRIFGSNLEWFNEAGGLSSPDTTKRNKLITLAQQSGQSVYRFPGGILADYYHWVDGTGPQAQRPVRPHYTDPASSANSFGSPEFFNFLKSTGAQGLVTVNAGTGTAEEAAAWVAYANSPVNARRQADGFASPVGIKLWEVGNELYLPGNPGEPPIGVSPEIYAGRFNQFSDAMRAVDPSIKVLALGVANAHSGPASQYSNWTETVLRYSASKIDMLAVHNSYFPILQRVQQAPVASVYPALWAAPEAVDKSLTALEALIARYENGRKIGIAITEWGALFATPYSDPYWVDHSKTMGSGVFTARMLQVFMQHPRVQMANHFKFTDNGYLGLVSADNQRAKVPYYVMQMMAKGTGNLRIKSTLNTATTTYSVPSVGIMWPESNVAEITQVVTRDTVSGKVYVNLVNRSMSRAYKIKPRLLYGRTSGGVLLQVKAAEPTAHNGRDVPSWWGSQWLSVYEPYTSAAANSIALKTTTWTAGSAVTVAPFSVVTIVMNP